MKPRFSYAVVCDGIRREDNGKHILIGVYGAAIYVREFPADLALSFYVHVENPVAGPMEFEFRLVFDDLNGQQTVLGSGSGTLDVKKPVPPVTLEDGTDIALPGIPVAIDSPGRLTLEARGPTKGRWSTLRSIRVDLAPKASVVAISS